MTRKRRRPSSMLLLGLLPYALSFQPVPLTTLRRGGLAIENKRDELSSSWFLSYSVSSTADGTLSKSSSSLTVRSKEKNRATPTVAKVIPA